MSNLTELNLIEFFDAVNPARTIDFHHPHQQNHYVYFSSVRGNKTKKLLRQITRLSPYNSTCQLLTGYIGCGKSTELLKLKANLEDREFHVFYFESSK